MFRSASTRRDDFVALSQELAKLPLEQLPPIHIRVQQCEGLINEYIEESNGRRPPAYGLYWMGNYMMRDYISDVDKHKKPDEYPFLTLKQFARRGSNETSIGEHLL